ncbi:MAG: hypothetical protein MI755_09465 [Sphingomonadales bacterium]|nr:hypothetical protein [Sphingomonadales bacterium]
MRKRTCLGLAAFVILLAAAPAAAGDDASDRKVREAAWAAHGIRQYVPPAVRMLAAEEIAEYPAIEARQGAAADSEHFYAIVNFVIGKYSREDGALIARWVGERGGPIGHINSCFAEAGRLLCANSNHPGLPMASSVEIFDTATMTHVNSKSLGVMDAGSLVWFDRYGGGWIAGFAHYDDETGLPYKDHTYASVVTFDAAWRRTGGFMFPPQILARMAPQAASGGAVGPDGRLYVMGHDRPEMYVLEFPKMGPALLHIATVAVPAEGQAFAFDPDDTRRVWAISRPRGKVLTFRLPEIDRAGR